MSLKHLSLIAVLFVASLVGYLGLRSCRLPSKPDSSMAAFFLFRVHCPMPTSTGTPASDHLQANAPF